MRTYLALLGLSCLSLSSCTSLENDLQKGVRYGSDSGRVMTKADEGRKAGQLPDGINAYLWRAALDSVGFLPLETVDPRYGRVVTQWYSQPAESAVRSKITIEILDPDLRRDTIRVTVVRQVQDAQGHWSKAPAPAGTAQSLEDSIFAKARDISPY